MTKPLGQLSKAEKSEKPEKKEVYWTPTEKESLKAVSYTHLTLPTTSSV